MTASAKSRNPRALTRKRERFCREYLVDLNATQAAIRAGYSRKTAKAQASALLAIPRVSQRVSELIEEQNAKRDKEATPERILEHLGKVAFARKPAKHVRVSDKVRALELFMRHLGLVGENQINVGVNVQPLFTIAPDSQPRVK